MNVRSLSLDFSMQNMTILFERKNRFYVEGMKIVKI